MESLPPENSSTGPLELGGDLPHDEDRLVLELVEVGALLGGGHAGLTSVGATASAAVGLGFGDGREHARRPARAGR